MISICIITKNEKDKLERNLKALLKYPLEVVVVDTGSTDGTQLLLQEWKNRPDKKCTLVPGDFPWCDDFAKARNYSISLATYDKILILDSDEVLRKMNLKRLLRLMDEHPMGVGRLKIRDKLMEQNRETSRTGWLARVFDRRYFHYTGRIHEQIVPIDPVQPFSAEDYYYTELEIFHDGYFGNEAHHQAKSQRNIALLEAELHETGPDPYILYHLGKNFCRIHACDKAVEAFSQALSFDLDPRLEYVIEMVEDYGYALLETGQPQLALGLESVYEAFGNTAEFRLLMGHIYMRNALFEKSIAAFLSAAECKKARSMGSNTFLAWYNAGVVYEGLGRISEALSLYQKCGAYEPALNRIQALRAKKG